MPTYEYAGNVIPAPAVRDGSTSVDTEILYSAVGYTQKGVTLKPGAGILPAGTVLGRITSSKLWTVYNDALSDGTQVARGILRQAVDTGTDANGPKLQGNIVLKGTLRNSKVSGADANALTDLKARVDTVLDTFTF